MKYVLLASTCALALSTVNTAARAESSADAPIQEIIVTATRDARSLADVPVSASIVTSDQVRDTPAQSLDDILRRVPGVNLPAQEGTQAHPTGDNVSMRGLGGIHALVMVDGVPINDPFFGYVQWGRIPLENIDHVEVVRGGGSPLWGNFAMGGAINVITRTADKNIAIIDAGGGSYGTYRSNLYGSYGVTETNRISVNLNFNGTDGFMPVPVNARRPFDTSTSFYAKTLELRDDFKPSDDLIFDFRFSYHQNDQQLATVLSTNNQETFNYIGSAKKLFSNGGSVVGTVFHTNSTFVTANPTVTDSSLPFSAQTQHPDNTHTTPFKNTGGSLVWSQPIDGILRSVTLGGDVNDVRGSDSAAIFDQTGTQIRTDIGRGEELFIGGFAQASIRPVERLEILASGRVQNFQELNGFDGNPGGTGKQPNQSYTSFDPRINVRYALTSQFAVRGAYYEFFRAPTLDNLYRGFASNGGIYYPNAQLKPETLKGGEVGIDYVTGSLRTQLTYYRTNLHNLITTANLDFSQLPPGFFYGGRLINAGSARAQGFEAEVDWNVGYGFTATFGYTYADSYYTSNPADPGSVGFQLQDVPKNTAEGSLTYQSDFGWRVSGNARYVSKTAWSYSDHSDPGFPYKASADPHFIVDLSSSYDLRKNLQLYVQIQNLFDHRYIVNPGPYNQPQYGTPFEVFAGLRFTLE